MKYRLGRTNSSHLQLNSKKSNTCKHSTYTQTHTHINSFRQTEFFFARSFRFSIFNNNNKKTIQTCATQSVSQCSLSFEALRISKRKHNFRMTSNCKAQMMNESNELMFDTHFTRTHFPHIFKNSISLRDT